MLCWDLCGLLELSLRKPLLTTVPTFGPPLISSTCNAQKKNTVQLELVNDYNSELQ